jgi:asparagine synthase (glutamine-hydrolysing)
MCGIIGAWGPSAPRDVPKATSLIGHRGPDDCGHFIGAGVPVALGHTRLSIQDVSCLGHQPMLSADGDVALTFNGEIYNFPALRAGLASEGYPFRSNSDTEVLLALYLRDGAAMLSSLNGIFAFALWDARRGELLVARDALGVKPLYFSDSASGFAFSSEVKALLPLISDTDGIDAQAIDRYLTFLWCPGEGTPLRGVRKLGPGEAMVVRDGRIARRWTWYELPAARRPVRPMTESAAIAGTLAALRTAVHRQLISDVPVGAFLSGGLDSSAVVALAKERVPDLLCFTIDAGHFADEGMVDDLPYARRVARHLGVRLEVVTVDSGSMAADLEQMVYQLDEPLADPAPLNVLYISQLARRHGIKVLLSGAGGDDLFAGYRRHLAIEMERFWSWIPRGLRANAESRSATLDQRRPAFRRLAKLLSGSSLEGDARLANYFVWLRQDRLRSLYTPEFRREVGDVSAVQPVLEFLAQLPSSASRLERALAVEQRFFLTDHNLTYTDKMGMAVGVEIRVPFLDLELVEFAATLPAHLKQHGRHGKWVLKKAMEPFLPHDVIYRPKTGFGAPLRHWLRYELRDLVGDLLGPQSLRARGFFDPDAVQRLIRDNDSGQVDATYTLFSLLCIEIWCRRFVDDRLPVAA